MRAILVAVVGLMMVACSGAITTPTGDMRTFTVRVDQRWNAEQREQIELGLSFWRSLLEPQGHVINVEIGACRVNQVSCLTAVPAGDPSLNVRGELKIGVERDGAIVMDETLTGEDLALVTAHEFGHRIGLDHDDAGVMAEGLGNCSWDLDEVSASYLERRGLL